MGKRYKASWHGLIQAAMAARHFRCDYLWLDLLCINQCAPDDRRLQVKNMANIYRNAKIVLVMFGGCTAAQGLEHSSSWIDRAWTLQESTVNKETFALFSAESLPHIATHTSCTISSVGASITRLDGSLGVARVHDLLKIDIELPLGRIAFPNVPNDQWPFCEFNLKCFGDNPRAIRTMQIVFDGIHSDGSNKAITYSAVWTSIWMRTSTRPQDMAFSLMHLLGVELNVDYNIPLEALFMELVRKSSSVPVWFSIAPRINIVSGSGLIPALPKFTPHSLPTYTIDGSEALASTQLVDIDFMVGATDLILHPFANSGFELCGTVMDVRRTLTPMENSI